MKNLNDTPLDLDSFGPIKGRSRLSIKKSQRLARRSDGRKQIFIFHERIRQSRDILMQTLDATMDASKVHTDTVGQVNDKTIHLETMPEEKPLSFEDSSYVQPSAIGDMVNQRGWRDAAEEAICRIENHERVTLAP